MRVFDFALINNLYSVIAQSFTCILVYMQLVARVLFTCVVFERKKKKINDDYIFADVYSWACDA